MHFTTDKPMTMIKAPSIPIQTLGKTIQETTTTMRQASQSRITKGNIEPGTTVASADMTSTDVNDIERHYSGKHGCSKCGCE